MFVAREFVEVTVIHEDAFRVYATIRHADDDHLLLEVAAQDAAMLHPGAPVHLVQAGEGGLFQISSSILNCRGNLFVVPRRALQMLQRRRAERCPCDLEATFAPDVTLTLIEQSSGSAWEEVRLEDISLGGLRMRVGRLLYNNMAGAMRIALNAEETLDAEIVVIRSTLLKEQGAVKSRLGFVTAARFQRLSRMGQIQLQRLLMK